MHRDGNRLVIEPIPKGGLLDPLSTLDPTDEDFGDFDQGLQPFRDVEL